MAAVERPGGLTALAVINVVLCCIFALASLATLVALLVIHPVAVGSAAEHPSDTVVTPGADEAPGSGLTAPDAGAAPGDAHAQSPHPHHFRHHGPVSRAELGLGFVDSVLCAVLLAISAVGYLRMQRIAGRYVGSLYGVVALLFFAVEHHISHQPLGVTGLIALIYPVLTLIYVNTTFRNDLVL